MRRVLYWLSDYAHVARGWASMYWHRNPPKHYLGHIVKGKAPVILIPGITNKWAFLKKLGDKISLEGHPVYIVPKLGHNLTDIPTSAKIVEDVIDKNHLNDVTIVAHSKGGLIAKYLLVHDKRVNKLIAIATPFSGSHFARAFILKSFKELSPASKIITDLNMNEEINKRIISLIPVFDNHVWHKSGSYLKGAQNIKVDIHGHHKILFSEELSQKVLDLIKAQAQE